MIPVEFHKCQWLLNPENIISIRLDSSDPENEKVILLLKDTPFYKFEGKTLEEGKQVMTTIESYFGA